LKLFDGVGVYGDDGFYEANPQTNFNSPLSEADDQWQNSPLALYQIVASKLDTFYRRAQFASAPTDNYFTDSKLYKMVALPMVSVPFLEDGYQIELFGQFYNKQRNDLLNLSSDDPMYSYYVGSESAAMARNFAIGLGNSFIINKDVTLQTMFSSGAIPNHGDSTMAIGIDVSF
jgi:hypothetical protein